MKADTWFVPVNSADSLQLLNQSETEIGLPEIAFVRADGRHRSLRFVEKPQVAGAQFIDAEVDPASIVVMAIGTPDAAPTGGTFELAYLGNSTGLTTLAFNVSAASLQTALNANAAITAAGGVTVQAGGPGSYIITFDDDGARSLITSPGDVLTPTGIISISVIQTGDVSTQEIQFLSLRQDYLASGQFTASGTGGLTVTSVQAGSSSLAEIRQITISGTPTGGNWTINYNQSATWRLRPQANQALKAGWSITGWSGMAAPSTSPYFDVADENGPVRIWFDYINTGTPPATPTGGRLIEVDCAADTANSAIAALNTKLGSDAELEATQYLPFYQINIGVRTAGLVDDTGNAGTSTLTLNKVSNGTDGNLQGATFAFETSTGPIGFWININGNGSPATLTQLGTNVTLYEVTTITPGMVVNDVRDALITAISGTGILSAAAFATAPAITITGTIAASPITAQAFETSTTLFGSQLINIGGQTSGVLAYNASAADLQSAIGTDWIATKTGAYQWQLTATTFGSKASFTTDDGELVFAQLWSCDFNLSTMPMYQQFVTEGNPSEISSKLEIQVTEPGKPPAKLYSAPCTIRADVIEVGLFSPPPGPSYSGAPFIYSSLITDTIGGGESALDGIETTGLQLGTLYTFTLGGSGGIQRFYRLVSGTDAASDPFIIRPLDYDSPDNERVWKATL